MNRISMFLMMLLLSVVVPVFSYAGAWEDFVIFSEENAGTLWMFLDPGHWENKALPIFVAGAGIMALFVGYRLLKKAGQKL